MGLDDMLSGDESSECVRAGESAGHQNIEINCLSFDTLTRIDQQLPIVILGRFDIDAESRRRRDDRVVERMRRLAVGINVGIHIEQAAESQLASNTLKIDRMRIFRADLQIRDVEIAIIAISILGDEVGQFLLCCR